MLTDIQRIYFSLQHCHYHYEYKTRVPDTLSASSACNEPEIVGISGCEFIPSVLRLFTNRPL